MVNYNALCLIPLFCLSACSSDDVPSTTANEVPVAIELSSGVAGQVDVATSRANGVIGEGVTGNLPISLLRIDQLSATAYPDSYTADGVTLLPATMAYAANEAATPITFSPSEYYLFGGRKTVFLGWYPQSGSWKPDDGTVTFSVDGATDIRMAHGVEGSNLQEEWFTSTDRTLSFAHALTMVKVSIKAEKAEYIPLWGEITDIKFVGKQQQCVFTLPSSPGSTDAITTDFITGSADLKMRGKASIGEHGDLTLTAAGYTEVGYAMFAPHKNSTDKLQIRVTTKEAGEQPLITISYGEAASGKAELKPGKIYGIQLLFKATEITPSGVIEEWGTGGTLPEIPLGEA